MLVNTGLEKHVALSFKIQKHVPQYIDINYLVTVKQLALRVGCLVRYSNGFVQVAKVTAPDFIIHG